MDSIDRSTAEYCRRTSGVRMWRRVHHFTKKIKKIGGQKTGEQLQTVTVGTGTMPECNTLALSSCISRHFIFIFQFDMATSMLSNIESITNGKSTCHKDKCKGWNLLCRKPSAIIYAEVRLIRSSSNSDFECIRWR